MDLSIQQRPWGPEQVTGASVMAAGQDWQREMGRMAALAERCSAEGQLNLSKLLEAELYAQVRRAGWDYRPAVTADAMAGELRAVLGFLMAERAAPSLVAALEEGLRGLEVRQEDLRFEQAPDAFVCRSCGHVALGQAPDWCPGCGAWPGRRRKFVAIFNGDNTEPMNPAEVLALLARNADELRRLLEGLPEAATAIAPSRGEWSIREHVAHFYDTQEMLDTRLDLMLGREDPELVAMAAYAMAGDEARHPMSLDALMEAFLARREQCVARLRAMPAEGWWRTGRHPDFGRLTVLRQAAYIAFHEQTHLPEVEALRRLVA